MTVSAAEIRQILDALEQSGWDEAVITVDDVTISVSRDGAGAARPAPLSASPASSGAPPATPVPAETANRRSVPEPPAPVSTQDNASGVVVTAPTVGIFWRSPQPGAPPFVDVGARVAPGDTVCILEVMKLMNNVVAGVAGTVTAIHVENSRQVEFGTPLMTIAPE